MINLNMNQLLLPVAYIFIFTLSIFVALFLFWRACRHELFDNEQIFDVVLIGVFGGLVLGRIVGFLLNFNVYGLSIYKFLFFHVYPAFNFWGFIIGAFLSIAIFLRHKRTNVWAFCDLAVAPIVFGLLAESLLLGLLGYFKSGLDYRLLVLSAIYFLSFFILKRLATQKRHIGFFACLFFVFTPIINAVYLLVSKWGSHVSVSDLYQLALFVGVSSFGMLAWYRLAKRKYKADVRLIFGFVLLRLLGMLRVVKSPDEAGRVSRTVIFSPYSILRGFLLLLKSLIREIKLGILEFFYVLGIRR